MDYEAFDSGQASRGTIDAWLGADDRVNFELRSLKGGRLVAEG